jgi:hypothetical protein
MMNADGGSLMVLLFRLLVLSPKIARAFRDFSIGIAMLVGIDPADLKRWFDSTPQAQQQMLQQQPMLGEKLEALFVVYQQHVDVQLETIALRQQILTMPALPDEGY